MIADMNMNTKGSAQLLLFAWPGTASVPAPCIARRIVSDKHLRLLIHLFSNWATTCCSAYTRPLWNRNDVHSHATAEDLSGVRDNATETRNVTYLLLGILGGKWCWYGHVQCLASYRSSTLFRSWCSGRSWLQGASKNWCWRFLNSCTACQGILLWIPAGSGGPSVGWIYSRPGIGSSTDQLKALLHTHNTSNCTASAGLVPHLTHWLGDFFTLEMLTDSVLELSKLSEKRADWKLQVRLLKPPCDVAGGREVRTRLTSSPSLCTSFGRLGNWGCWFRHPPWVSPPNKYKVTTCVLFRGALLQHEFFTFIGLARVPRGARSTSSPRHIRKHYHICIHSDNRCVIDLTTQPLDHVVTSQSTEVSVDSCRVVVLLGTRST